MSSKSFNLTDILEALKNVKSICENCGGQPCSNCGGKGFISGEELLNAAKVARESQEKG